MSPWWKIGRRRLHSVPFEVACACGHILRGQRQRTHQVIPCPACGRSVFIFPSSPLPPPRGTEDRGSKIEAGKDGGSIARSAWRTPLLAGAGPLALVVLAFGLIFHFSKNRNSSSVVDPTFVNEHFAAGKKLLGQGQFHEAVRELEEAIAIHQKYPDHLSGADRKRLVQTRREPY